LAASTSRPSTPRCTRESTSAASLVTVSSLRWGNPGDQSFDYIPCGCEVHAARRFGDLQIPSSLSVGWWFDTPRYAPFFKAHINDSDRY
jgi:hypothetical protein